MSQTHRCGIVSVAEVRCCCDVPAEASLGSRPAAAAVAGLMNRHVRNPSPRFERRAAGSGAGSVGKWAAGCPDTCPQ